MLKITAKEGIIFPIFYWKILPYRSNLVIQSLFCPCYLLWSYWKLCVQFPQKASKIKIIQTN